MINYKDSAIKIMSIEEFCQIKNSLSDICCKKDKYKLDKEFIKCNLEYIKEIKSHCSGAKTHKILKDRGYIKIPYSSFMKVVKELMESR